MSRGNHFITSLHSRGMRSLLCIKLDLVRDSMKERIFMIGLGWINNLGLELSDNKMPNMNMNELSVVGYAMGGQIAIHAAALDLRIQNIASIAGFTPLRTNTNDLGNAGNYYYYQTHALIPKLGYFANREHDIPYDYDDLLESISPRKTLLYAPVMDKNADYVSTKQCIASSQQYWIDKGAGANYTMQFPNTVTDFSLTQFEAIADWFNF
eukprot:620419_1